MGCGQGVATHHPRAVGTAKADRARGHIGVTHRLRISPTGAGRLAKRL